VASPKLRRALLMEWIVEGWRGLGWPGALHSRSSEA
jgi:hypothetical protein